MEGNYLILLDKIKEINGIKPVLLQLPEDNSVARGIIVTGATSKKHAQGIADGILSLSKSFGEKPLGVEGYNLAEWILIDYNDFIIHIMQLETRELYQLEKLWSVASKEKDM